MLVDTTSTEWTAVLKKINHHVSSSLYTCNAQLLSISILPHALNFQIKHWIKKKSRGGIFLFFQQLQAISHFLFLVISVSHFVDVEKKLQNTFCVKELKFHLRLKNEGLLRVPGKCIFCAF